SRAPLCGAVSSDVAAARGSRAPAGTALEGADRVNDFVLQVRDVWLRRATRQILTGVTFDVRRSELVAIMGPSGSGKTTILRTIAGLEPFQAGRVSIEDASLEGGVEVGAVMRRRLQRAVGMVFQFHCLYEHLPALQNVWLAPVHAHGVARGEAVQRARELLAAFGVEHRAGA